MAGDLKTKDLKKMINRLEKKISAITLSNEKLQKNEGNYKTLIENIKLRFHIVDSEYNIIMLNSAQAGKYNMSQTECIGEKCYQIFENRDSLCTHCPGTKALAAGEAVSTEIKNTRSDGSTYYEKHICFPTFKQDGKISGFIKITEDITEVKHAFDALQENEKRVRRLIDHSTDTLFVNELDGKIIDVNQHACDCLQYTREELLNMNIQDIDPVSPVKLEKSFKQMVPGVPLTFEGVHKRKDNTTFPVEVRLSLFASEGHKLMLGLSRDISEAKRLQAQLQRSQKMEAIGTLAGGIAHDFNNILSAIMGYSEIALIQIEKGKDANKSLKKILSASERAKNLVSQILTFSRPRELGKKPVDIIPVVKETLKLLRASLPATIDIRQNIECDYIILEADPTKIHQIIMNLCTNAHHAMRDKGGVLEVTLIPVYLDIDMAAAYNNLESGPYIKLSVKDTGRGMEHAIMERIFEPYFTTKDPGEGTGLGLAVVHGIVKSYEGTIIAESEPGKSTTFHIFLPQAKPEVVTEAMNKPDSLPTGHEHILYVDDEYALTDIGEKMLRHLGYKITTMTSSVEALELFRALPQKFNLIISDMTMPDMTGLELAGKLLQIRPDIPIILCTGFSENLSDDVVKKSGIRKVIMKPIIMHNLAETIRKILDEK